MIYFDNNATTQTDPLVVEAMQPWLLSEYGNPSAGYSFGKQARKAIEIAREQVASLIDATPDEIIFTSGGTESNNTALLSAMRIWPEKKGLLISSVEHSAIYEPAKFFEKTETVPGTVDDRTGYDLILSPVTSDGMLELEAWQQHLKDNEIVFSSLIWANNETGVLSQIVEAAELAKQAGVYFHTDAVQAVGKVSVSVDQAPIHSLAISAHKFHGPKGIGALYVNKHTRYRPSLFGGGQESDRRSGTENVAAIVGMGVAAELAAKRIDEADQMGKLRDRFEAEVMKKIEGVEQNGHLEDRLPNTSNLYFPGVDGEGLLIMLDHIGLCCSPGSACSTGSVQPSRILLAMGAASKRARSSVRFSLSHLTTEAEVEQAVGLIETAVGKLRVTLPSSGGVKINTSK